MSRQFRAEICKNWGDFTSLLSSSDYNWVSTPFQTVRWMQSWMDTLGAEPHVQILPIIVYETTTNIPVILLPLIVNSIGKLRKIESVDLGLSDYNAPIIAPNLLLGKKEVTRIWRAIKAILPPHDMLLITKMPSSIQREPNPLINTKNVDKSPLNGNILNLKASWHDYHYGLERTFRKEIERSWRVLEKHPQARFVNITDTSEARRILRVLEDQQAIRMQELGADYNLNRPDITAFYRGLVKSGIEDQSVRLTALMVKDEIAAVLLGIVNGTEYSMIRLSTGDKKWKNCSPGRLLIYKTMEYMHTQSFTTFDFTIGDYNYKRRLGAEFVELSNIVESGNLRHIPHALTLRLRFRLQLSPTWCRFKNWQKSKQFKG